MGYISLRRARLRSQLTAIQTQITNLNTAYSEALASGVESYSFDSGEGSQRTTRRKLSDFDDIMRRLEARENHIINELHGMGVVNIKLRRKP